MESGQGRGESFKKHFVTNNTEMAEKTIFRSYYLPCLLSFVPSLSCLNPNVKNLPLSLDHSVGKHKAFLFQKRLGITLNNKKILEIALIEAIKNQDAMVYKEDAFGVHYDVKFYLKTNEGESWILSSWIIRYGENFPRLTNVYPINK